MRPPSHRMLPKLALCLGLLLRPAFAAQRENNPTPDNFVRRAYSAVTILNNWIYIDGGEVSQILDGKRPTSSPASKAMNSTLAIDLRTSWLASDVKIREIKRPDNKNDAPPPLDVGGVWNHPSGQSFYVWGGIAAYGQGADRITKKGLWKFTPDSNNPSTGAWSLETPSNPAVLSNLRTSFHGGFVTVDKTSTGYWIGGYASANNTEDPSSKQASGAVSGLVSFNMATGEWKNETASDLVPDGNLRGAAGVWLPRFGPNGLVTFLGGRTMSSLGWGGQDFTNITFFDPVTRMSYVQTTTGDAPTPRKDFCAVTVESPRGGHEIVIFGGAHPKEGEKETYEDAYVLSLPGFQWFKVADTLGGPRASHSCVVAGQRQMISIGGTSTNNFNGVGTNWDEPDRFGQGIGVFDMTALTWSTKGQYDAYAKKYESPNVVNEWYKTAGDLSKRQWSSSAVQALFVKDDTNKPTDGNSQTTNDSSTPSSESSKSSTGAIVGGVVGGIAVLLAVGLGWFFMRRRNRSAAAAKDSFSSPEQQPLERSPLPQHSSPQTPYYQGHGHSPPPANQESYMSSDQVAKHYVPIHSQELPASYTVATELPATDAGTRWELDSTSVSPPPRK